MFDAPSPARAHVEFDPNYGGLRVAMFPSPDTLLRWPHYGNQVRQHLTENAPATVDDATETSPWLRLDERLARALYESLGDYFGHSGNDTRALRRDYDAERARVDKLITHLTDTSPLVIERQAP